MLTRGACATTVTGMPKKTYTVIFRRNFIDAWTRSTLTFLEHCERFGVSRQTGYEWLMRVAHPATRPPRPPKALLPPARAGTRAPCSG